MSIYKKTTGKCVVCDEEAKREIALPNQKNFWLCLRHYKSYSERTWKAIDRILADVFPETFGAA